MDNVFRYKGAGLRDRDGSVVDAQHGWAVMEGKGFCGLCFAELVRGANVQEDTEIELFSVWGRLNFPKPETVSGAARKCCECGISVESAFEQIYGNQEDQDFVMVFKFTNLKTSEGFAAGFRESHQVMGLSCSAVVEQDTLTVETRQ
ncbi:MAG: hypothetical protein A2666_01290 [Parcubacteria group bacterium RIFCSPHIGHO2_01_FULL_47_10b]|nr:MAG: hypothetical protein A2666_01290 [Parcubacteria group bacterium RIFCSPHIGHO2_01_FULL_47_10b]